VILLLHLYGGTDGVRVFFVIRFCPSCGLQFSVLHRYTSGHGVHMGGHSIVSKSLAFSGLGAGRILDRGSYFVYRYTSPVYPLVYAIGICHWFIRMSYL
jgi:hypothetical protein